ncbi:hypothetical protein M422DRAFT_245683 [Sphaerobolus stellatus SS14]|nr:hypothetical protein M422DRAFT_245683 [Sphaerobolus stellatus SS14]
MAGQRVAADVNAYPSLAWIAIPALLIPLGLYIRSRLAARKLAKTGIGKGAPGFQTGVRRLAVTPEIAARLRAGEQVTPAEIEAAVAAAQTKKDADEKKNKQPASLEVEDDNEWLPDELKRSKQGVKGRKSKRRG